MKAMLNGPCFLRFWITMLLCLVVTPQVLHAQAVICSGLSDEEFPCSYQIEAVGLQPVPALFKLQARVAQAKLPVGEGLFDAVVVKLLSGATTLCQESFANVEVHQSVLNLEIGRNMTCELDEVIAENTDLAFQICLGGTANCLSPIEFAATPYAIKATYAHTAKSSDKANVAAQAHYSHRMTADRDLFMRNRLGTGYLDFNTQEPGRVQSFYDSIGYSCPVADDTQECAAGGFLQWTPIRDTDALHLHIAGKKDVGDQMQALETLVFASADTIATGDLKVQQSATVEQGLVVAAEGAHVTGDSDINGTLLVSDTTTISAGGLQVEAGGAHVTGASDVSGTLSVSQTLSVTSGGAQVTGDSNIAGQLAVASGLQVSSGGAHVIGDSTVTGILETNGGLVVTNGSLVIEEQDHRMQLDAANGTLDVYGKVRFHDVAEFSEGTTQPNAPYVLKDNEQDLVALAGGLYVEGGLHTGLGNVEIANGHLLVEGDVTIGGALRGAESLDIGVQRRVCLDPTPQWWDSWGFACLCEPGEAAIAGTMTCHEEIDGINIFPSKNTRIEIPPAADGSPGRTGWAAVCEWQPSRYGWRPVNPISIEVLCVAVATEEAAGTVHAFTFDDAQ